MISNTIKKKKENEKMFIFLKKKEFMNLFQIKFSFILIY